MFQNAYCTAPLSGPSRGAMFTGCYPGTTGLLVNGAPLQESLQTRTLGTLVKNAGYECAYGGKWHVPELDIPDKVRGFDQIYKHSDDGLAEACVEFLSRKHDKPFFLVASYDNPHNICEYARSQNLPYGNLDIPEIRNCPGLPPNFAKNPYDADVIEKERENNFNVYPTATFTPEDWRMYRYTYYRLVEKVDREIGKIVDAIDKNNLWENTVVIFSSDHGDGIGAHHWNQKSALYEEVVNIPFIVTLPGKKHAGTKLPQLISNSVDFLRYRLRLGRRQELPEDADGKCVWQNSRRRQSTSSPPGVCHYRNTIRRQQDTGLDGTHRTLQICIVRQRKTPRTTVRHAERPGRDKKPDDGERLYESGAGTS